MLAVLGLGLAALAVVALQRRTAPENRPAGIREEGSGVPLKNYGGWLPLPMRPRTYEEAIAASMQNPYVAPNIQAPLVQQAAQQGLAAQDFNLKVFAQRAAEQMQAPPPALPRSLADLTAAERAALRS